MTSSLPELIERYRLGAHRSLVEEIYARAQLLPVEARGSRLSIGNLAVRVLRESDLSKAKRSNLKPHVAAAVYEALNGIQKPSR